MHLPNKTPALAFSSQREKPLRLGTKRDQFVSWCRSHKWFSIPVIVMILLLPLLGLLALLPRGGGSSWISPSVLPSPEAYGPGSWSSAYSKAAKMVKDMTLKEMNNVTIGYKDMSSGCVGVSGSAPRLGFPGLCLHDAENGVRDTDGVNAYASGIHIGASWNKTLANERAKYMGAEFKKKGVHVALGPVVGPIGRIATDGRFWEGFGADPYLTGILGAETVRGLQESVIASIKHFVGNEQETNRNPSSAGGAITFSSSSNVNDQTMHEVYAWPFQDAIEAGVGSVMCSYNRINNTYACENSKMMNGVLKGEMNFQGFVVSDWGAQHSGLPTADAGLDMAMPTSATWDNDQLANAVTDGSLNRTRLVDMATRVVAAWYQLGMDDSSWPKGGIGMPADLTKAHPYIDARDNKSTPSILQQAVEGHVLVKNQNSALPLQPLKVMSIFGYDAMAPSNYTPDKNDFFKTNWGQISLTQAQRQEISANLPVSDPPGTARGYLFVGGGSGSNTPAYLNAPFDAITQRAYRDGTTIFSDFTSFTPEIVSSSEACLVFINEFASEAWDRPNLADADSDKLIEHVAASCNNTIVIIHNAGIRLVDPWIDHDNVTAVMFAHLPGQDAGRSLVTLLYGDESPSGRLTYTVAKKASDYGSLELPCLASNSPDKTSPQCDYSEGVDIDYRSFLNRSITPRFAFGYGLTYSTFEYSDLSIKMNASSVIKSAPPVWTNGTTGQNSKLTEMGIGGLSSLFDSVGTVKATVANTGKVEAGEVSQLYLTLPGTDAAGNAKTKMLRGFQKNKIAAGSSADIQFDLRARDVSTWDVTKQAWVIPAGTFKVEVGRSVLDTPLTGTFDA